MDTYRNEYPCGSCDLETNEKFKLRRPKDFLHKGNQFPCSICDFKRKCKLKTHIEYLHGGTKYP